MGLNAWIFLAALACTSGKSSKHTPTPKETPTKEKLFYIYESGLWPNISTASLYKRDVNELIVHKLNLGAGPLGNLTAGEYHTDQYQLFSMIFNRALKDPRRTLDPEKATSFLIPYDFASDCAFYKNCARSEGVCFDFRKCPLAPDVERLLLDTPYLARNQGRDHVLIVGMNYAMNHHLMKPKCRSLLAGICANCTKFAIDDYSYMYSGNDGITTRGDSWHAIPFPADFHWTRDVVRPFPWENRDRPILVSYIGSTRSYYGPARKLRGSIVHYCGLHEDCVHQSYGLNGTRHSFKVDGHHPLQISQRSVFCFQPIGDLMTRKGLFDSLLQGCIPVVFDALTASVMYTWHWEETFWNKIMVEFLAHPTTHRYFDPVAALRVLSLNTTLIQEKQALIRERVFELQYGLDGYEDLYQHASRVPYLSLSTQKGELGEGEGGAVGERIVHTTLTGPVKSARGTSWPLRADGTPLRDAYDIVADYFLAWHSGESADVRVGTVPECWDGYLDKMMNKCRPGKEPAPPT